MARTTMPVLSYEQKEALDKFLSVTMIASSEAFILLKKYDYDVDRTLRVEWENIPKKKEILNIESIYNIYEDPQEGHIGIEGAVQFIQDLGLELSDPAVLAIAYQLNAPSEGVFTKLGFIFGWFKKNAETFPKMKKAVSNMQVMLKTDPDYFKTIYRFTFTYIKAEGTRSLPTESAIAYWELLLSDKFSKLPQWNKFITEVYKKSISKDTWNMILEFSTYFESDPKLANYDLEASWPSVIDEFVDYLKENDEI